MRVLPPWFPQLSNLPLILTLFGRSFFPPITKKSSPDQLGGSIWKVSHPKRNSIDLILLDGGNMSFNLEKRSGKKCFMIGAQDLIIDWSESDAPHYWEWISFPGSRFEKIAELVGLWWLCIRGTIETRILSPKTTYSVYLVIKFREHAFGLGEPHTDVVVEFVGGGGSTSGTHTVYLKDPEHTQSLEDSEDINRPIPRENKFPRVRKDGWMEIEMGDFYNDHGEDGEVRMMLKETSGYRKGGLIMEGIELRPK